jgi:DNA-binding GntR family transcriptional regulator
MTSMMSPPNTLVDAIGSGSPEEAVAAMEQHVVSTVPELIARLGGDDSGLLEPLRFIARRRRTSR